MIFSQFQIVLSRAKYSIWWNSKKYFLRGLRHMGVSDQQSFRVIFFRFKIRILRSKYVILWHSFEKSVRGGQSHVGVDDRSTRVANFFFRFKISILGSKYPIWRHSEKSVHVDPRHPRQGWKWHGRFAVRTANGTARTADRRAVPHSGEISKKSGKN